MSYGRIHKKKLKFRNRERSRLDHNDWVSILHFLAPEAAEKTSDSMTLTRIRSLWPKFAGNILANHTQPFAFSYGKLIVHCDHNTFAQQLQMLTHVIEKKICAELDFHSIRIKVSTQKLIHWAPNNPSDTIDDAKPLSEEEQATIAKRKELFAPLTSLCRDKD